MPCHVIVGTAGHIDHGKTSLVKALTGIDADRLEEEKRRGITIDLGFAHTQIGETNFAFIDVPGHEKIVRNMLAGIGGIDMVLLVVAADEGVMPQTREHFDICKLLGIKRGVVALTKTDAAAPEQIALAIEDMRDLARASFLERAPIVQVSSTKGIGIEQLRSALSELAAQVHSHDDRGIARLPIDRVFTMKGFGTVITGTLISGVIKKEDELEVHPSGKKVRVRSIQVHGSAADSASAGQRTAINVAGVEKSDLARGMMLTAPKLLRSTKMLDAAVSILPDAAKLKAGTMVHFHAYSAETVATVKELRSDGERNLARLKLDDPLPLVHGDHFVLRRFSPVTTIGGGQVLDPLPSTRPKLKEKQVAGDALLAWIKDSGCNGSALADLVARSGRPTREIGPKLADAVTKKEVADFGGIYFSSEAAAQLKKTAEEYLKTFHKDHRLKAGINSDELRSGLRLSASAFESFLRWLEQQGVAERTGELIRLRGAGVQLESKESAAMQQIANAFASAGLKVPALPDVLSTLKIPRAEATKIVTLLLRDRTLIKLGDDLVFHRDALAKLKPMLAEYKAKTGKASFDVAAFKDLAGISRKYAIPLLEHLDRERVTRREGNIRHIL
jgi:selenocysteine-specific elongation factor